MSNPCAWRYAVLSIVVCYHNALQVVARVVGSEVDGTLDLPWGARRRKHSLTNARILILTGAGASAPLGAGAPLPMMPDWASSLVSALGYAGELIGIRDGMRGDEFEAALGTFIAFSKSLDFISPLHELGGKDNLLGPPSQVTAKVDSKVWLSTAQANVDRINKALFTNLHSHFNQTRVDDEAAYASYRRLHEFIRQSIKGAPGREHEPVFLSHATTNFDSAIEAALDLERARDLEHLEIQDGFALQAGGRNAVWAPNLLNVVNHDGTIPVFHLHGAVGWYFSDDGSAVRRRPSDDPFDPSSTPALLLPDNTKAVSGFPGPLQQMWDEFRMALKGATHVLVIGHSLHDAHIVDELKLQEKPVAALALTEPNEDGTYDSSRSQGADELRELLLGITVIAGKFGQRKKWADFDEGELKLWLRENLT